MIYAQPFFEANHKSAPHEAMNKELTSDPIVFQRNRGVSIVEPCGDDLRFAGLERLLVSHARNTPNCYANASVIRHFNMWETPYSPTPSLHMDTIVGHT